MRIAICGICGRNGSILLETAREEGIEVAFGIDVFPRECGVPVCTSFENAGEKVDCIIDFSNKSALYDILAYAERTLTPCVLAVTGYDDCDIKSIERASESVPIYLSSNYSAGITATKQAISAIINAGFRDADIEIVEYHHCRKKDAPSGTALRIAEFISYLTGGKITLYRPENAKREPKEICLHSVRGGTVPGKHEITFFMPDETISVTHEAYSPKIFARGALNASKFLVQKNKGLYGDKSSME